MGTEDWVLKGTKLITNTKKQRLKIQSRGEILKNTILKKQTKKKNKKQKRNPKKTKSKRKSHRNYKIQLYIYIYIYIYEV